MCAGSLFKTCLSTTPSALSLQYARGPFVHDLPEALQYLRRHFAHDLSEALPLSPQYVRRQFAKRCRERLGGEEEVARLIQTAVAAGDVRATLHLLVSADASVNHVYSTASDTDMHTQGVPWGAGPAGGSASAAAGRGASGGAQGLADWKAEFPPLPNPPEASHSHPATAYASPSPRGGTASGGAGASTGAGPSGGKTGATGSVMRTRSRSDDGLAGRVALLDDEDDVFASLTHRGTGQHCNPRALRR